MVLGFPILNHFRGEGVFGREVEGCFWHLPLPVYQTSSFHCTSLGSSLQTNGCKWCFILLLIFKVSEAKTLFFETWRPAQSKTVPAKCFWVRKEQHSALSHAISILLISCFIVPSILAIVPQKPKSCLQQNLVDCPDCGGLDTFYI